MWDNLTYGLGKLDKPKGLKKILIKAHSAISQAEEHKVRRRGLKVVKSRQMPKGTPRLAEKDIEITAILKDEVITLSNQPRLEELQGEQKLLEQKLEEILDRDI